MVVISRTYEPFIPEFITVHLGEPDEPAENVTLPFPDYIKNVASSEIYPTWPESAIRANIYAQISFALNRIYTEWYRSQGYNFDITNTTKYDQSFVNERDVFENISNIVDEIFNSYVVRQGRIEPLFTPYCDGEVTQCEGLLQWGTVDLANQGMGPYEILQNYYGNDIEIISNAPIRANFESYPLYPLSLGSFGRDVTILQNELKRIRQNYPSIPIIVKDENGIFGGDTEAAVKQFQRIFNLTPTGVVGSATWYKIKGIYNAVKGLGELVSEGVIGEEVISPFELTWDEGSTGMWVRIIEYYIRALSCYYPDIPSIDIDLYYGPDTVEAIKAIERKFDIIVDGVVGIQTWSVLDREYRKIWEEIPKDCFGVSTVYPGYILSKGMGDRNVTLMQEYLQKIAQSDPDIPNVRVTGIYDNQTQDAVEAIQKKYLEGEGSGLIGPNNWTQIALLYENL